MAAPIFLRRYSHAGALCAGIAHYAGTAKGLREEGIDPAARLRAFPIAVRPPEPNVTMHTHLISALVKPTAGLHSQGAAEGTHAGLLQCIAAAAGCLLLSPRACR